MALDAPPRLPGGAPLAQRYAEAGVPRRLSAAAWLALEALHTVRSLLSLGVLLLIALVAINFASASGQLGQRLSGAWERTEQTFAAAGQAVADAFDPTHPPRYAISQDTELASLSTLGVGQTLGSSSDYTFTVKGINRRADAGGNPDVAQYAVLERQYTTPRETKLLGITVRTDRGEQQYVLDRGETFRIGSQLYKVNWISATAQQMAIGVYRAPDQFAGKMAFDSD